MTNARWVMHRAGLLNFWYYDEEIFPLKDGKLLLRGANGSGKSVTMQSFLPVLLDGRKSPDRLDPFGSRARRMEDYLLGEKEVSNHDERTGYLFIEYKKQNAEQYITTGMGMQARRNKGMKSWYFLITDNRRVGIDFHLSNMHGGEKVPLSAKELENRIELGGYVVHSQREYMELVNKYVFGFQSIEAYEDLIKLLIQLRSPKLSKDFKPTVIYEILESALPPLTDDELRHLSDTIESMDQAAQQLEQLEREYESVGKLKKAYHSYNQYVMAERAKQWVRARQKSEDAEREVHGLTKQQEELEKEILQLKADEQKFKEQKLLAESERDSLQNHEVWSLEKNKRDKKNEADSLTDELRLLDKKWTKENQKLHQLWQDKEQAEMELTRHEKEGEDLLEELAIDARESAYLQHEVNVQDYERSLSDEFDFTLWLKEAKEHQSFLSTLEKMAEELERLKEEHERLQRQSSEKKALVDEHQKELDHLQEWFDDELQKLENAVFLWMEEHEKLQYSAEIRQDIARALQGLYERSRFEQVRDKLFTAIHAYEAKLEREMAILEEKIENKSGEIAEAEMKLLQLKSQKMLEPERSDGTELYRAKLKEKGQAFVPFYAAVEFADHVTEEQKERIESALKKTGILDSLIMDKPITPEQDAIISTNPRLLGFTLADYLIPDLDEDSPISNELVDEVLRSIPLEQDGSGFHIDVDGTYSIGCLIGHAPFEGPSKYIGRASRKRHQQEQIQLWTEHLGQLQNELAQLNVQLQNFKEEQGQVQTWKMTLPDDHDLLDIHDQISEKKQVIRSEREQLQRIDEEWKEVNHKLTFVKKELHEKGKTLNISLRLDDIRSALEAAKSYIEFLYEFKIVSVKVSSLKTVLQSIAQGIEESEMELDSLKGEQNLKQTKLKRIKAEIQSIEEQLQLKGIDEVRSRIQAVQNLLKEAEEKMEAIYKTLPKKEAESSNCLANLDKKKIELHFWQNMSLEWEKIVEKEKNRGFVDIAKFEPSAIFEQYEAVLTKYERSKLLEQLSKAFLNEQQILTEYRMVDFSEDIERPQWFGTFTGDHFELFIDEWERLKSRRIIQMEYRGQQVSPYFVSTALEKELEQQQEWLDEQDRQLYEDIIVNTVGTILRNRIQRAQTWVKQMDTIMAERDSSSGLTLSIAWKPLTAESEQELDTRDLVALLQRDSKFLGEEDLERITKHFRSRIAKAKELTELRSEGATLHQVLKEVLDYRKWFTFVLSYSRVNEPKRELTNNAFYRFSGGEKAMAMYIPLFTAAYSRYKEAGEMAPYIISLDEAFAGVDENNIRDMFEVVEQLGFNYIMNSQALWGDYDTVSSLSICELVRPKNANYVTVIRYEWDGKQKSLVIEADEQMEELVTNES